MKQSSCDTMSLWRRRKRAIVAIVLIICISCVMFILSQKKGGLRNCSRNRPVTNSDLKILLDTEELQSIVENARYMHKKPVMITLVNDGYSKIALNWLCHTQFMAIHSQVLIISTEHAITQVLAKTSKEIKTIVIRKHPIRGDQEHGHAGYIKLLLWRTQILNELISHNIHTLLFEFDSIWIKNPLPLLSSYENKTDMLCVNNYKNPGTVNGGFFYLFPTIPSKVLFRKLFSMLNALYTKYSILDLKCKLPTDDNDQEMLSRLIRRGYANIDVVTLPYSDFADGVWYDMNNEDRILLNPYIIHNDYIVGNKAKIMRFKAWGHWFLDESERDMCNISKTEFFQNINH